MCSKLVQKYNEPLKCLKIWWSETWVEIKPNLVIYIFGLIIVILSWMLGGKTMAATALITVVAPIFAIHNFYVQQRIARVQKIYYEESLLDVLRHVDKLVNGSSQNYNLFIVAMNCLKNDLKSNGHISPSTIDSISNIAKQISGFPKYLSSSREMLITLFGGYGYKIHRWLFKCDSDIGEFNSFVRETLHWFQAIDPKKIDITLLDSQNNAVLNYWDLIGRHFCLTYMLNEIVSRIGVLDFKSREQIKEKIKKDTRINIILKRLDESFKILFGWVKLSDGIFLSYLEDEEGNRYRLIMGDVDSDIDPKIEKIKENPSDKNQMKIVLNDAILCHATIVIGSRRQNYSKLQIEIANKEIFDEKPEFYPESRSFQDF